ncbi:hypothetical protein FQN57_000917 [Myotisia sp. PD_48]|nr:hypothetical protein FQN57_000917 [Myotisia sp. PD_48]
MGGIIQFFRSRKVRARNDQVTNAAQLTLRQSLWPLTIVTVLFFLWGFAYGLLDTLNKHFQNTLHITRTRSSGLQAAYFGAYPLASLGYANWMLRKWGYKSVFILGLGLYGIGALCMWPAGLNRSFGGFCGATFVIGSGLASLETAANPYLAVCGPPKYAEIRINVAQAFNAIGTVVGPVLGSYAFFTTTEDDVDSLRSVQWVYLAIAIFVFFLAGVFYISNIPEITDADMEFQVAETHAQDDGRRFRERYQLFHAAIAQFLYVGGQGIRGLGKHYKRGSGFIVAGVSGGAAVPPVLGRVADMHNSTGIAMVVPTVVMVFASTYAVCVNFVPSYRDPADKTGDNSSSGITNLKLDEKSALGDISAEPKPSYANDKDAVGV